VNIKKMLKQAQAMQEKLQQEVNEMSCEGTAGGGMVTVVMRGTKEVTEVRITPEVIDPEDPEMLQDLVLAAFNDACRKVDDAVQEKMGGMGAGLGLPGL
jgi:DNA-binding YbaB/EbfC family protein